MMVNPPNPNPPVWAQNYQQTRPASKFQKTGEVPNFASFLRVTGMRFLRRRLIEAEHAAPNVDARVPQKLSGPRVVPLAARP